MPADAAAELAQVAIDVVYVEPPATRTVLLGREPLPIDDVTLPAGPLTVGSHAATFRLPHSVGGKPTADATRQPVLRMKVENYTYPDEFDVPFEWARLAARRPQHAGGLHHEQSILDHVSARSRRARRGDKRAGDRREIAESSDLGPPQLQEVQLEWQAV